MPDNLSPLPDYAPRVKPWIDLPEAANPDAPPAESVVLAEDLNRIDERLTDLTRLANGIASVTSSTLTAGQALQGAVVPGTQLVFDGKSWQAPPPPRAGAVIAAQPSTAPGYGFVIPRQSALTTGDEVSITIPTSPFPQVSQAGSPQPTGTTGRYNNEYAYTSITSTQMAFASKPFALTKSPDGWVATTAAVMPALVAQCISTPGSGSNTSLIRYNFGIIFPPGYRPPVDTVIGWDKITVNNYKQSEQRDWGMAFYTTSTAPANDYFNPTNGLYARAARCVVTATGEFHIIVNPNGDNTGYSFYAAIPPNMPLFKAA